MPRLSDIPPTSVPQPLDHQNQAESPPPSLAQQNLRAKSGSPMFVTVKVVQKLGEVHTVTDWLAKKTSAEDIVHSVPSTSTLLKPLTRSLQTDISHRSHTPYKQISQAATSAHSS
jgi:hypothetical protein